MGLAAYIISIIDRLYLKPISRLVSPQIFRYGCCGLLNMSMDAVWYFVIYHCIVAKRFVDLGFVTISPHILSLVIVFPITFFCGFWLNRNVAFRIFTLSTKRQLLRYAMSVAISILLNYVSMKVLVEYFGIWATPSKVLTTIICTIYSYLIGRYYTFASRHDNID
ncbi:MAG: GtrA family protein [Alistipes sp.]|nr:GtrA family protein [Alistipes sp.]